MSNKNSKNDGRLSFVRFGASRILRVREIYSSRNGMAVPPLYIKRRENMALDKQR